MKKFILDLSHHNNLRRAQMTELVSHGMSGIIAKSCQGNYAVDSMVEEHLGNADYLGIPYAIYHWPDPIQGEASNVSQVQHFSKQIDLYKPRFIAFDAEHYWISWTEWYARNVKKENVKVRVFSSDALLRYYRSYLGELRKMRDKKYPGLPIVAYSARWFINGYCRPLASLFQTHADAYWNAYYFGWKDFDNDKAMNWKEFDYWLNTLVKPSPAGLPDSMTKWDIWQAGELTVKGFPRLDYNVITDEAYKTLFGGKPPVVVEPPPVVVEPVEPVVPASGVKFKVTAVPYLNGRTSPKVINTNLAEKIPTGTILTAANVVGSNAWIEYKPGHFACVQQNTKRYMEVIDE